MIEIRKQNENLTTDHFGTKLRKSKYGHYISTDNLFTLEERYVIGIDRFTEYAYNLKLNLLFYKNIDRNAFNEEIDKFIESNSFKQVTNLKDTKGITGFYLLVLDEFKQCYVGKSTDIQKRVSRHWSLKKEWWRFLWGSKEESILSIDFFRAGDTTRIYYLETSDPKITEKDLINSISFDYTCNRIHGDYEGDVLNEGVSKEFCYARDFSKEIETLKK